MITNLRQLAEAADAQFDELNARIDRLEAIVTRLDDADQGSGRLRTLLDKLVAVADLEGLPAPKGTSQDDGVPTNKPPMVAAQKAEPFEAPLAGKTSTVGQSEESGEVVEAGGEAPVSPPDPVPPPFPKPDPRYDLSRVTLQERMLSGPLGTVQLSAVQANLIDKLCSGPVELGDLTNGESTNLVLMSVNGMRGLLGDAGLEIGNKRNKFVLRLTERAAIPAF